MNIRNVAGGLVVVLGMLPVGASAQRSLNAPRADGHETPLMVYDAVGAVSGCAPLAVISPGAGGTERGYRYLAEAMAQMGYTALVMGHRESGPGPLGRDIMGNGIRKGAAELVENQAAETGRLLDVGAALKWAGAQCRAPFRVLLGHSMGGVTVMLEAGAKNQIGVTSPPAGQKRFDAYVALSPEGPGEAFADQAWTKVRAPMLMLTGTRDLPAKGTPEERLVPWKEMPGAPGSCQWLGVIDGATHMNFGGIGRDEEKVTALTVGAIKEFLPDVRRGSCPQPAVQTGMTIKSK
ncbi:MAG: alpha/beta hydrolase [Acidobacteria bacterium]|nr:alpha/beta hydrolase [Acidobacteriota bacterium]